MSDTPNSVCIEVTHNLVQWVIKPFKDMKHIHIEGFRGDDERWATSTILHRLESHRVSTHSGTEYILQGPMDMQAARLFGIPRDVRRAFENGFPVNWQELVPAIFKTKREDRTRALDVTQWTENRLANLDATRVDQTRMMDFTRFNGTIAVPNHKAVTRILQESGIRIPKTPLRLPKTPLRLLSGPKTTPVREIEELKTTPVTNNCVRRSPRVNNAKTAPLSDKKSKIPRRLSLAEKQATIMSNKQYSQSSSNEESDENGWRTGDTETENESQTNSGHELSEQCFKPTNNLMRTPIGDKPHSSSPKLTPNISPCNRKSPRTPTMKKGETPSNKLEQTSVPSKSGRTSRSKSSPRTPRRESSKCLDESNVTMTRRKRNSNNNLSTSLVEDQTFDDATSASKMAIPEKIVEEDVVTFEDTPVIRRNITMCKSRIIQETPSPTPRKRRQSTPKMNKTQITTPKMDRTQVQSPKMDRTQIQTPKMDRTQIQTPKMDRTQIQTPKMDRTQNQTPRLNRSQVRSPENSQKFSVRESAPGPLIETPDSIISFRNKSVIPEKQRSGPIIEEIFEEEDAKPEKQLFELQNHLPTGVDPKKVINLTDWSFRFNARLESIIVLGYVKDDPIDMWCSTAIVNRIDARHLQTSSGKIYKLDGPMDDIYAIGQGYTRHIINAFKDGFPVHWHRYIQAWLATKNTMHTVDGSGWVLGREEQFTTKDIEDDLIEEQESIVSEDSRDHRDLDVDLESDNNEHVDQPGPSDTQSSTHEPSLSPVTKFLRENNSLYTQAESDDSFASNSPPPFENHHRDIEPQPSPPKQIKKNKKIHVPKSPRTAVARLVEEKNEALRSLGLEGTFTTSKRSGRIVKPRMKTWAGQNITYDVHGNAVSVTDPLNSNESPNKSAEVSLTRLAPILEVKVSVRPSIKKNKQTKTNKTILRSEDEDSDVDEYKPNNKSSKSRKRKTVAITNSKRKSAKKSSQEQFEEIEEEIEQEEEIRPQKPKCKTRWNQQDLKMLQRLLKVVQPVTSVDWLKVHDAMDGIFAVELIKQKANDTFGYDLQIEERMERQRQLRRIKLLKEQKAAAGTLAARQEADRFMLDSRKDKDTTHNDFFAVSKINIEDTVAMPSLLDVSIASAMETPEVGASKNRRYIPMPMSGTTSEEDNARLKRVDTPTSAQLRKVGKMTHSLHTNKAYQMAQGRAKPGKASRANNKSTVIQRRVDMSYIQGESATYREFFTSRVDPGDEEEQDDYFEDEQ